MSGEAEAHRPLPLEGVLVVDLSRMLPGAVLARTLLDLGARLVKVEEPGIGDPMRSAAPLVAEPEETGGPGMGAGFASFLRGAESLTLDLRQEDDARRIRPLLESADVLIESFRPTTLARWGLDPAELRRRNPRLVVCSLSAFGSASPEAIGHDINLVAPSGLLDLLGPPSPEGTSHVPGVQVADITAGLLAASSILAALLLRERTGEGLALEQPLASGVLPLLTWGLADAGRGEHGVLGTLLAGSEPEYRVYTCGDGKRLALGAIENKSWRTFLQLVGLEAETHPTADEVTRALSASTREHWLAAASDLGLPITPVDTLDEALESGHLATHGLLERTPLPGGATAEGAAPYLPSVSRTPKHPAPFLGEHTKALLEEFGSA